MKEHGGRVAAPMHLLFSPVVPGICPLYLRNRHSGERWNVADIRGARRKWRSRDKERIPLSGSRSTHHAPTRIDIILVGIRSGVAIRERLQESNDLILFLIR